MIYCNFCFNCINKPEIEKEEIEAKEFWRKHHTPYLFSCGARYNPENQTYEIQSDKFRCENRFYRYKNGIPKGEFELQQLTWKECEYIGILSNEKKIKVTGTGKRSLRIVPLTKKP